jgi:hypothetical protein
MLLVGSLAARADMAAGLKAGQSLEPFTSNVVTGSFRGQQHCFVCGLVLNHPAVLVFSRRMDEPTGRLLRSLDGYMHTHVKDNLLCWFVFLGPAGTDHEVALENQAEGFAAKNHAAFAPLTVLADPQGPPGYQLDPGQDVVVYTTSARKITSKHVYSTKQWDARSADGLYADIQSTLKLK